MHQPLVVSELGKERRRGTKQKRKWIGEGNNISTVAHLPSLVAHYPSLHMSSDQLSSSFSSWRSDASGQVEVGDAHHFVAWGDSGSFPVKQLFISKVTNGRTNIAWDALNIESSAFLESTLFQQLIFKTWCFNVCPVKALISCIPSMLGNFKSSNLPCWSIS